MEHVAGEGVDLAGVEVDERAAGRERVDQRRPLARVDRREAAERPARIWALKPIRAPRTFFKVLDRK